MQNNIGQARSRQNTASVIVVAALLLMVASYKLGKNLAERDNQLNCVVQAGQIVR